MFNIILSLIYFAITLYLMNKAKNDSNDVKAATLDSFDFPTADETRSIPFGYGTFEVNGPNVLWYGDYSTSTIYQEVKSGGFLGLFQNTDKVNAGFAYNVGLHFGLCFGGSEKELDLKAIKIDNKYIFTTNSTGSFSSQINNKNFFGEYENGPGGIVGNFTFYSGQETQTTDSYLESQLGSNVPFYNDICHLVWKGGYIGNNNSLKPWSFILKRIIEPHWAFINKSDINGSCNAASVIYDMLTNKNYGLGLSDTKLDLVNFKEVHETLFNEGYGVSFIINDGKTVKDVLNDVFKVIDGQLNIDFETGKIFIKLNREETPTLTFNEDNIINLTNYSRGSLSSLINEVKIKWTDINDNFKSKIAQFQNQGSRFERDRAETTIIDYSIINDANLAQRLAVREAIPLTTPLLKCDITVNRKAYNVKPGDVLYLNWPKLGIESIIMRVLEIDYGTLKNSQIKLNLIQDKFGIQYSLYSSEPTNSWTSIDYDALACDLKIEEAPFYFTNTTDSKNKILTFSKKPNSTHNSYNLLTKLSSDPYILNGVASGFCPVGVVSTVFNELSNTINIINESDLNILKTETDDRIASGYNLALIIEGSKKEFINFKNINLSSGIYTLSNINRGLLDTIPENFTTAAKIYFFSYGFALNNNETFNNVSIFIKAITRTARDTLEEIDAPAINFNLSGRRTFPISPSNLIINTQSYQKNITTAEEDLELSWSVRNRQYQIQNYNEVVSSNIDSNEFILEIYDNITNTLLITETLTTLSYIFTDETIISGGTYYPELKVLLKSKNGSLESLYNYDIIINRI